MGDGQTVTAAVRARQRLALCDRERTSEKYLVVPLMETVHNHNGSSSVVFVNRFE